MANVSSGIFGDANFLNLKSIKTTDVRSEIPALLVQGESIVCAFTTIRDQVIFTNKRVFVVNVQGITGKKVSYLSYPYSKVQFFGVETAGVLDIDSEMILSFSNHIFWLGVMSFAFARGINNWRKKKCHAEA